MNLDIKVDVLLGDFDRNFDANYYLEQQYPLEIVHTPDQKKRFRKALIIYSERKIP
jgi:thiamine pyrophosphokinase